MLAAGVLDQQVIDEESDAAAAGVLQQLLAWQERARGGRDSRSANRPPPRKRLVSGLRCAASCPFHSQAIKAVSIHRALLFGTVTCYPEVLHWRLVGAA